MAADRPIDMTTTILGDVLALLALLGAAYMLVVAFVLARYFRAAGEAPTGSEPVTLLKPLHGAEPDLAANLATFLVQRHGGAVQMICGVQRPGDPAGAVVEALEAAHPGANIVLVRDASVHGANGKISNLVNMSRAVAHDVVILSDSDIAVAPDYLARVIGALGQDGVGAVTCLYRGRGDAGFWSHVAAAGLSWQFLPGAVFGVALGIAQPCMGSTIALRRETLDRIGGFARFADILADDHAIGVAVRELGLKVAVPPMLVTHASTEASLGALWRHELRWGATVRELVPGATYAASIIAYPLPIALLTLPFAPVAGLVATVAALASRLAVALVADRIGGRRTASLLLLPLRDLLSFAIFIASFFARSVDWRGATLTMSGNGRVLAETEIPHP